AGAAGATKAAVGLPASARAEILSTIENATDARVLAGAVVAACAEDGSGPPDDVLATVVKAYDAAPARFEGIGEVGAATDPATATDDPAAAKVEEALAAGRLGDRRVVERDAGRNRGFGLVPTAFAGGLLLHGTAGGAVAVVDLSTGRSPPVVPTAWPLPP